MYSCTVHITTCNTMLHNSVAFRAMQKSTEPVGLGAADVAVSGTGGELTVKTFLWGTCCG